MKAISPHRLLTSDNRKIDLDNDFLQYFRLYEKLCIEKYGDVSQLDMFVAGYFMGCNYNLKEKYKKLISNDKLNENKEFGGTK